MGPIGAREGSQKPAKPPKCLMTGFCANIDHCGGVHVILVTLVRRGPAGGAHLGTPGGGAGMDGSDVVRPGAALRRLSMIVLGCLNTF